MAIIAPMAKWRPLTRPMSTTPLTQNIICLHTMVGTLEGSWSWSNRPGGTYWHFGVGGDGEIWQCQDLAYKSAANLEGNWRCIPIETEDTNAGYFPSPYSNPPWTPAQIAALATLVAWLCRRFNIPCQLVPNSRPEHRGIAYHKQGCEPGVVPGGENWSSSFGKTCPNNRITQVDDVIRGAQRILGGGQGDWFDMATKAELAEVVQAEIGEAFMRRYDEGAYVVREALGRNGAGLKGLEKKVADLQADVDAIKAAVIPPA